MSKRGENIYKRKDGRWEGRYEKSRINHKIVYGYVYGKTYKEVKNTLNEIKSEKPVNTVASNTTFSLIAEKWLETMNKQLKWSSIVKYKSMLNLYILPRFGKIPINKITVTDISEFNRYLLVSGGKNKKGLSGKTVVCIMSLLKNIILYAVSMGLCTPFEIKCITLKQQKPMRILSVSEQQKLNKYLNEHMNLNSLGILLCLYTGLRVGEICALKWENINFSEQYIYVRYTMQRIENRQKNKRKTEIMVSSPKSECSVRKIPIPDDIFALLKQLQCPQNTFFLTGTSSCVEPRTMQNRFKAVLKKCRIEDANFHALRHTFATRCIECGFDVKSLSEILGHASVTITLNRYVHPSMETKQKNMNMLTKFLAVK